MKLIIGLIMSLLLFSCDTQEDEVYIVPRNYIGYIVIIYDQQSGAEPKYEGGKRVYEIPSNGIFKTQFKGNYEWTHFPEFYYEKIAPENKVPFTVEPKNIPFDTVVALSGASGNANKDLAGKKVVRYALYYIGNNIQIDTAYEAAEKLDIAKLGE